MKQAEAYNRLCGEYLDKCKACDECVAEFYCIKNNLRKDRVPQEDCPEKIKAFFRDYKAKP